MNPTPVIAYRFLPNGKYELAQPITYYSARYRKTVTCPSGMISDGATGAVDVASLGWWVHDRVCVTRQFDDGTPCNAWQQAWILSDILMSEGRWFRARTWWLFTGLWRSWAEMWSDHDA